MNTYGTCLFSPPTHTHRERRQLGAAWSKSRSLRQRLSPSAAVCWVAWEWALSLSELPRSPSLEDRW